MPHKRLLQKLLLYGIDSSTHHWIQTWMIMTQRSQQVLLDGECSLPASVLSGVPQGTVLGPLMFLIYINDISEQVSSPLHLFTDDCLLYRVIHNKADAQRLQLDLDCLTQWSEIWQMSFNVSKCVVMKCCKSLSIISFNYSLNGYLLDTKTEHTYLGITFQNMMSWASHINSIGNKASRTLNFLKGNLSRCSQKVMHILPLFVL